MTYQLIRGNAMSLPLADESVDLVVTSPPYFALRSYTDGGEHYDGQIGSEATPQEFLEALWAVTSECRRVLKPSGSMFVNLGDKYSGVSPGSYRRHTQPVDGGMGYHEAAAASEAAAGHNPNWGGIPAKSLMGLPWRYAIGCIDQLGLILRAEIVWCLSGGARVYARHNGRARPIMLRDLVRAYRPEDVQLWNGEKWTQVLGWNKSPDTDGALELELRSGERVGCTPGHQWPTERGLVRADEIQVGDVIDTCTLPDGYDVATGLPGYDIGWFVGLYIAEGSRSGTTIQFAGHVGEEARHRRLQRIAAEYDGSFHVHRTNGNACTANITGSVLSGILDRYVTRGTAKTKRLTVHAWQRDNQFLRGVVEGYLEGDGAYDAVNDRWRLGFCTNDELAADLRTLAARLGASLTLKRTMHKGNYGDFPGWRGEWRRAPRDHQNAKPRSEVVAIRRSRARHFYDVGVADEPHLFALASGVLTHNSKPNGLPESVTDRVRRSHEQWFHFTKEPRYFSAVDEIRESPANPPRRTLSAPSSRPTLGPELAATFRTDHGPTVARGWCQLGSLQQPVSLAMAGQAERFEVVDLVGFFLRVEGPERDYVVDLKPTGGPALDAPMAVAVESALADLAPSNPSPGVVAARPSGVLCSGAVVGDALGRAEVLGLEITPVSAEGIAARITLDLKPGRATLLVWDAFAGCHDDILPPKSSRSADTGYRDDRDHGALNPLGKLPGSVWTVPTEPLRVPDHLGVDHFAAFPSELPRRIILGWSPSGVCVACGEGRRPVVEQTNDAYAAERARVRANRDKRTTAEIGSGKASGSRTNTEGYGLISNGVVKSEPAITGYACACPDTTAPTRPAVVLDPFAGTGTVPAVAHILGRHGIGIDLSADYLRLADWRCNDPALRAKVLGVDKPKPVIEGQTSLFDEVA